jgi:hypothetical protein
MFFPSDAKLEAYAQANFPQCAGMPYWEKVRCIGNKVLAQGMRRDPDLFRTLEQLKTEAEQDQVRPETLLAIARGFAECQEYGLALIICDDVQQAPPDMTTATLRSEAMSFREELRQTIEVLEPPQQPEEAPIHKPLDKYQ